MLLCLVLHDILHIDRHPDGIFPYTSTLSNGADCIMAIATMGILHGL